MPIVLAGWDSMIHKLDNGHYVISENEVWRPGSFESEEAARIGSKLDDATLSRMQERANPHPITLAAVTAEQFG